MAHHLALQPLPDRLAQQLVLFGERGEIHGEAG
jgi:hypothetical protein